MKADDEFRWTKNRLMDPTRDRGAFLDVKL
jgi:hypothetical protein